jgi:hypothetical protein
MMQVIPAARSRMLIGAGVWVLAGTLACAPAESEVVPRSTLVIGIEATYHQRGAFKHEFDDAVDFAAYYLYGRLRGLGDLQQPSALFVGSIGGDSPDEAKAFRPIHDFQGRSAAEIARDLRAWYPPEDRLTDFNPFFERVATLIRRQNLGLAPIEIVILSDGVPDVELPPGDTLGPYARLNVDPLEYLARNVTIRLLYPAPNVAVRWEQELSRRRVRLWTQDRFVMEGWRRALVPGQPAEAQDELWRWIADIVDFRVRRSML